ncbi:DEAD/DEAH box helicase family protein [Streptomyces sp. NPDC093111]|uniref:DEAD/DEAH box helicase family protein n=1 Tax=Streptomyces sp. NPDC093111 TaxID=3154978 RepID=UPI00341D9856
MVGSQPLSTPQEVLDSCTDAIQLHDLVREGGLRPPQAGALHSVLGSWYSQLPEPGLIVMPTGTGKTETMLTLVVACRPPRLLVLVPSVALRDQIAESSSRWAFCRSRASSPQTRFGHA